METFHAIVAVAYALPYFVTVANKGCPTLQFLPCIVIPYFPLCNTKKLSHFAIALAILCNTSKLPQVVIMLPQLFNKI